jgi:DNA-binding HxlR family transcriptional regulator
MARTYGQFCPLSIAAELLCQRWTLLVVSRVLGGCTRFNDIHRGLPRMSTSLLSQRLTELQDAGILESRKAKSGPGREYSVTEAGKELAPLIDQMAVWGHRWARDMELEDLDPAFLVWSLHLSIDRAAMPSGRTVVEFDLKGGPEGSQRFWLVSQDGAVEMCLKDPGLDVDLAVTSDLWVFVDSWRGFRDLETEIRARRIRVLGPRSLVAQFPTWLRRSAQAPHARRRPGRERRQSERTRARRGRS